MSQSDNIKPVSNPKLQSGAKVANASSVEPTKDPQDKLEKSMSAEKKTGKPVEIGGPKGLEPTRYGDWEAKGRCYDF